MSYWNCYRRSLLMDFWLYPGADLLEMLRSAAEPQAGRPLPRYAPPTNTRADGFC